MTPKERFIAALERRPLEGLVPHFELVFFLTMEKFGRLHPTHRHFSQWDQMSAAEQRLHIDDVADLYIAIAEAYDHSAIFFHQPGGWDQEAVRRCLEAIAEKSGGRYFTMMHGDCTFSLPSGEAMMDFSLRMFDDAEGLKEEARRNLEWAAGNAETVAGWGVLDGFALCSDYCFNVNPFFTPDQFGEFVQPYLAEVIRRYRELGFYSIKHTDGNIMPILDRIADCRPDALHSLDPQGGVDIAEVKRRYGDRMCLIGNVNCAALQTGGPAEIEASVRCALEHGMPGYGYIFSTSNCVYTGLPLERYEFMVDLWKRHGVY